MKTKTTTTKPQRPVRRTLLAGAVVSCTALCAAAAWRYWQVNGEALQARQAQRIQERMGMS